MDRVKEACFSILGRRIYDARFLDLFAGTGSVGIEALSRGAKPPSSSRLDRRAVQTIQANLKVTGLGDQAIIRRTDVLRFLKNPPGQPLRFHLHRAAAVQRPVARNTPGAGRYAGMDA